MKNHDLIERYFENSLSPEEQKIFNDLLQTDKNFNKEFEFHKDLKRVIEVGQKEELKQTVSNIEFLAKNDSKMMVLPKKWIVAASLLLIVGMGTWTVKSTYFPSNEALYQEYFHPERNTVHPVVRGEEIKTIEYIAFIAYEEGNYYKAINLFNSVDNPDASYVLFYKGLCFLAVDKPENAIQLFNRLKNNDISSEKVEDLCEKTSWYLSLAYVKINENKKAVAELNELLEASASGFKQRDAQELLNYLN